MPVPTLLDRGRGCLLGLAIGDALGAPLEGLSGQQIRSHYGVVVDFVDGARAWKRRPFRWRSPGLYTDDTQQALVLAEVLLESGQLDLKRVAQFYRELAQPPDSHSGAFRGTGRSLRQFLDLLSRGQDVASCAQDSAGGTAAARVAPLSLFYHDDPEALSDAVLQASLMTHLDVRTLTGALGIAFALRRLLAGEERSASLLLRVAGDLAQVENRIARAPDSRIRGVSKFGRSLSACIARTESLLELDREAALQALVDQANRQGPRHAIRRPTQGFPAACLPTCLYFFVTSETPEEALVDVVNLGGDADTAGAVVGALCGAYHGVAAIPERWLARLQNREGLETRAEALLARSREGLEIPALVATERQLSRQESICRQDLLIQNSGGNDLGGARYRR